MLIYEHFDFVQNLDAHHKPQLTDLLASLGLDLAFESGCGAKLTYRNAEPKQIHCASEGLPDAPKQVRSASDASSAQSSSVEILDLVGGYGALLLGHSHPHLTRVASEFFQSERPMFVQGSAQRPAAELASELSRRLNDDYVCVFGNSGTEAIEAGMKHAMLERRSRRFIVIEGSFHGKTLGALQATHNHLVRCPFDVTAIDGSEQGIQVQRIPRNDLASLERALQNPGRVAAFLFEPIQGEAGVRALDPHFLLEAERLCREHNVPLFADECQTGVGRTGAFLACQMLGIRPDYIALSKSLGGGICKIATTLIRRPRYCGEFDFLHTSTFAADEFSCTIAREVLALVDDELLRHIRELGIQLRQQLLRLQTRFPKTIADVRGCGLMMGLEFHPPTNSDSFTLRLLSSQDKLLYLVCSYLLREHRIRVLPTLSDPWTLRMQPPACITSQEISYVVEALECTCQVLQRPDVSTLARGLLNDVCQRTAVPLGSPWPPRKLVPFRPNIVPHVSGDHSAAKVAWLCHMIDVEDLVPHEPGLDAHTLEDQNRLLDRLAPLATPVLMSRVEICSIRGERVHLFPIMLPVSSRFIKRCMELGRVDWCRELVRSGVSCALELGCSLVSLGQYTSIVTRNGIQLSDMPIGLTSGNSFTVALAIQAIGRILNERQRAAEDLTLAVVGSVGNIGRTCARLLSPRFHQTILLGTDHPRSVARLNRLADKLSNARVATDLDFVKQADVVVSAINSPQTPLMPEHFAHSAVVCDVSVPASVNIDVKTTRPDVTILRGGLASLPYGEDLQIASFPLVQGQTFGCMAEALLLGFEGVSDHRFTGEISLPKVRTMESLAARHGFTLADVKVEYIFGSAGADVLYDSR